MEENDFIAHVHALLYKCDKGDVNMQTHFKTLQGWNLILAVSFVEMVQEEYEVELCDDDLRQIETIAELYTHIHTHCKKIAHLHTSEK